MAERGGGNAIPPLKVNFAKVYLLRVLTTLRVVQNVKKAIAWSSRAEPSFGFYQNSPVKNFRTAKIFSSLPHFCQQNFFTFQAKKSAKGLRPARSKACPVGQSILTDESADRDFSNRKKSLLSRLLAFKPQKSVQLLNLTLWHFLHVRLFCFLYVFQKSYRFRYHFSYQ